MKKYILTALSLILLNLIGCNMSKNNSSQEFNLKNYDIDRPEEAVRMKNDLLKLHQIGSSATALDKTLVNGGFPRNENYENVRLGGEANTRLEKMISEKTLVTRAYDLDFVRKSLEEDLIKAKIEISKTDDIVKIVPDLNDMFPNYKIYSLSRKESNYLFRTEYGWFTVSRGWTLKVLHNQDKIQDIIIQYIYPTFK